MAAAIYISISLNPHHPHHHQQQHFLSLKPHNLKPILSFTTPLPLHPKLHNSNFNPSFCSPHSPPEPPSSYPPVSTSFPDSYFNQKLITNRFLTPPEAEKLEILEKFQFLHEFESGSLFVRVMRAQEIDVTVGLLSESFAQSVSVPLQYVQLLKFVVKGYMLERQEVIPNMATLVGFYRGEDGEVELAGTVEVSFNENGANATPPSPSPPRDSPYICNMTVNKSLRRAEEIDATVGLLLESFPQLMSMPSKYVQLVDFYQYMVEIQGVMPDMATLVALYRGENGEVELGGTVAVSFNKRGVTVSPPTPRPPKDSPYIYNMTVKKSLRRRRIGWHLLKACEELIRQMRCNSDKVYLHCRMIDRAPFNMYTKAGYNVIKNDNIFVLLTLQRRKYLMCKKMPFADCKSEVDIVESCDEYSVSGISA